MKNVTRTINTYKVTFKVYNLETGDMLTDTVELPHCDEKKVKKSVEYNNQYRFIKIENVEEVSKMYKMPVDLFMELATCES